MAQHNDHGGTLLPQDTNFDNADQPGIAQPYSQAEVEELLYGTDRPASERLAALNELRDESSMRESADWGDQDPASLLDEIDRAIDELSATIANADDNDDYAGLATNFDNDSGGRLDTLSPDDVDAREAIESDGDLDEEDDLQPLDKAEWEDGDGFRQEKGVH